MTEWTTEHVRRLVVSWYGGLVENPPSTYPGDSFDRWLAAHDADVAAKAVKHAAEAADREWIKYRPSWGSNPANEAELAALAWALKWLHARAAAALRGGQS